MESFMTIVTICLFGILCYVCSILFGIKLLLEKVLMNQTPSVNLRDQIDYSMKDALETRKIHDQVLKSMRNYPVLYGKSKNLKDVFLEDEGTAVAVLRELKELTEKYGLAALSDFYYLVGIEYTYEDELRGWTDLSNATLSRHEENLWRIDFPPMKMVSDIKNEKGVK